MSTIVHMSRLRMLSKPVIFLAIDTALSLKDKITSFPCSKTGAVSFSSVTSVCQLTPAAAATTNDKVSCVCTD